MSTVSASKQREQVLWTRAQKLSFVWKGHGFCKKICREDMAALILTIFQMHGLPEEMTDA